MWSGPFCIDVLHSRCKNPSYKKGAKPFQGDKMVTVDASHIASRHLVRDQRQRLVGQKILCQLLAHLLVDEVCDR